MTHDAKIGLRAVIWIVCCIALSIGAVMLIHTFIDKAEADIPIYRRADWYKLIATIGIPILIIGAQGINNILVHGWSVWLFWLGAEDMGIIINELTRRKALLEKDKQK